MLPGFKLYFAVGGNGDAATRGLSRRENTAAGRAGSGVTTSSEGPGKHGACVHTHTHTGAHAGMQKGTHSAESKSWELQLCWFLASLPPERSPH